MGEKQCTEEEERKKKVSVKQWPATLWVAMQTESSKRPNLPRIQIEGQSTFITLARALSNMRCIIS